MGWIRKGKSSVNQAAGHPAEQRITQSGGPVFSFSDSLVTKFKKRGLNCPF